MPTPMLDDAESPTAQKGPVTLGVLAMPAPCGRVGRSASIVAAALSVWWTSVDAQDLGFLTSFFLKAHSITIHVQSASIITTSDASTDGSKCAVLDVCGAGTELIIDLTSPQRTDGVHLELGFGASYLRGFGARDPSLDLRGAIRSFPTLSAYLSGFDVFPRVAPYLGASFGISDLWRS